MREKGSEAGMGESKRRLATALQQNTAGRLGTQHESREATWGHPPHFRPVRGGRRKSRSLSRVSFPFPASCWSKPMSWGFSSPHFRECHLTPPTVSQGARASSVGPGQCTAQGSLPCSRLLLWGQQQQWLYGPRGGQGEQIWGDT